MTGSRRHALTISLAAGLLAATPLAVAAQGETAAPPTVTPRIVINAGCSVGAVYSVASDHDGNVAAAGYCGSLSGAYQAFVAKADPDGTVLWTYRPGGSLRTASLALDAAGGVLVAGQVRIGATTVGTVLKIDAKGAPAWSRTVESPAPGSSSCASVATDADNSVYASCGGLPAPSGAIVAFDSNGAQLWRRDGFEAAQKLFTANGKLYAASLTDVSIVDRASGIILSDVRVSDTGSVRVGRDGKVYVKGNQADRTGADIAIYDESLNPLGAVTLTAAVGAARSYDTFDVDALGNIYVLGAYYSTAEMTGGGTWVAEFHSGGDVLWQSVGDASSSFTQSQSPSALGETVGGLAVSVSTSGKCYVSTSLSLLEFPVR